MIGVVPSRHFQHMGPPGKPPLRVAPESVSTDEALCDRFLPDVLRWCARLGGPLVDPEDAAQEVMIIVLRRAHTVHDPAKLPAWVFGVTRRTLAWQRRKSIWRRFIGGVFRERADPTPGPSEALASRQEIAAVHAMLDELGEELREVLVLADIEGRTDEEVASLLMIPSGTAKSRLRRARARIGQLAIRRGLVVEGEE